MFAFSVSASRMVAAGTLAAMIGCASAPVLSGGRVAVASALIVGAAGEPRGTAEIWQDANNIVHVEAQLRDLPIGTHGIHFHATGLCEGAAATPFASAGEHFNPLGRMHGLDNPGGPHAGDAPNFTIGVDQLGRASFTTDRVSLTPGSTTLFDGDGSALVIHATADDQISQPAGNSGGRIACGVVRRN